MGARRQLARGGVDEGVHSNLNGAVDLFTDLFLPASSLSLRDSAPGANAQAFSIGYQGSPCSEGESYTPSREHPLHPPPRSRHDVDEKKASIDDDIGVDALKEPLPSPVDDSLFLGAYLALLLDLLGGGFYQCAIDAGFHGRVDEIPMRKRFERLRLESALQNLLDLVS